MVFANTILGVDVHLDEELLTVKPLLVCGKCSKRMEQITPISFKCLGCGETVTRESK